MVPRVRKPSSAKRAVIVSASLAILAGCGSGSSVSVRASADPDPPPPQTVSNTCATTVLGALSKVAARVYHEGVSSGRTASALSLIEGSIPLREAVEQDDPKAVRVAARALIATGHMTNLEVLRQDVVRGASQAKPATASQVLADVGGPDALAPLHGTIVGASGAPIATFVASVWADNGFLDETDGIAEGMTALRTGERSIAGSFTPGTGALPAQGALTVRGVDYRYTSFAATAYPTGQPLRVYLFKSIPAIAPLCGRTREDTTVNTVSRVATLIYVGETGRARAGPGSPRPAQPTTAARRRTARTGSHTAGDRQPAQRAHRTPARQRRRTDALRCRRPGRARSGARAAAPARADDRQLRALDTGRSRLPTARTAAGGPERDYV